jgi:hypothetical protein
VYRSSPHRLILASTWVYNKVSKVSGVWVEPRDTSRDADSKLSALWCCCVGQVKAAQILPPPTHTRGVLHCKILDENSAPFYHKSPRHPRESAWMQERTNAQALSSPRIGNAMRLETRKGEASGVGECPSSRRRLEERHSVFTICIGQTNCRSSYGCGPIFAIGRGLVWPCQKLTSGDKD